MRHGRPHRRVLPAGGEGASATRLAGGARGGHRWRALHHVGRGLGGGRRPTPPRHRTGHPLRRLPAVCHRRRA
uniref:Uncharacterized protein n=1 Tax=Arundo donax TaxID=35708 RepID=A0A0A8ZT63_ARUDO